MTKTILVTGGSRGIGAAVSRLAGRAGYRVALNYATNADAAARALAVQADVGSEPDVIAMFAAVDSRFGWLDALVNNAGIVDLKARVDEMSAARLERMMRINVVGSILCAREAVKRMSTKHGGKGGAIVNVSSAAAKHGSAAIADPEGDATHASGGQPDRAAALRHIIPMQRAGQPEEVARAILWLVSDEASYTTGALMDVSGGR